MSRSQFCSLFLLNAAFDTFVYLGLNLTETKSKCSFLDLSVFSLDVAQIDKDSVLLPKVLSVPTDEKIKAVSGQSRENKSFT